jgi:Flp pilus assembly protein TadG
MFKERTLRTKETYRLSRRRGAALIEAALATPLLMLMACGAMDLARVFLAGVVLESAARAGAQFASFSPGKAGASDATNAAGQKDVDTNGISPVVVSSRTFCGCTTSTTEVSCGTGTCDGEVPAGYVETTATYTFVPLVPYPGMPGSIPMVGRARFRVQ